VAYTIEVTPAAQRDLRALTPDILRRVDAKILALADNPRPHGATRLTGDADLCRIRVGDHRVIYQILDRTVTVVVVRIRHRREVYR
jgi:mRNA interferase RelE/StbE